MRIRRTTAVVVRSTVPVLRKLTDKSLSDYGVGVARLRRKDSRTRLLGRLIEREIQRRIRRGEYDLWK